MRKAVKDRYIKTKLVQKAAHIDLAKYFQRQPANTRRAEEEPFQWQQAEEWARLKKCLLEPYVLVELTNGVGMTHQKLLSYWHSIRNKKRIDISSAYKNALYKSSLINKRDLQTAAYLNELAVFLNYAGYYSQFSESLILKAIIISSSYLGYGHWRVDWYRLNLVSNLSSKGDFNQAKKILTKILTRNEKNRNYRLKADVLMAFGSLNQDMRNFSESEYFFKKAYLKFSRNKNYIEDAIQALTNYGAALITNGKYEEGELIVKESFMKSKRAFGTNNPWTLINQFNYAKILHDTDQFRKSYIETNNLFLKDKSIYGSESMECARDLELLGSISFGLGRFRSAVNSYSNAYRIFKNIFGKNHLKVASVQKNWADLCFKAGDYDTSTIKLREVIAITENLKSEPTATLGNYYKDLGFSIFMNKNDDPEVEKCFRYALKIHLKARELDRESIDEIKKNLGHWLIGKSELLKSPKLREKMEIEEKNLLLELGIVS
jgi:hypothetical protein